LKNQGPIDGIQFSLFAGALTAEQIQGIKSDLLSKDDWYYDTTTGDLNVSWTPLKAEDLSGKLILSIPNAHQLIGTFQLESSSIAPEAYRFSNEEIEIRKVRLNVIDGQEQTEREYHLYQNIPNPFTDGTIISFSLPGQEQVRLAIYDIAGKQVFEYTSLMEGGYHEIPVKASSLKHPGIYYYTLYTSTASFTRKMSFTNN
jgi:hypothetical protein